MSIIKKLASDTAIYGIPSIVGRSINFLLIFYFAKFFTPDFLAPHIEFYAYAAFFFVVLPHGMETAFFNFSRKKDAYKDILSTALVSTSVVVSVFVVLVLLSKSSVAEFVGHPSHPSYVVWFVFIMFFDVLKSLPYALLRYTNQAKKFATIKSVGIIVNVLLNVFFIVYYPDIAGVERSVEYIFIANLIASGLEFLLLVPFTYNHLGSPSISIWKEMFSYAWPLIILGFAGMVNETFDRLALRKLLPADSASFEIGVYGTFYKLSMLMTIFIQAFRYAVEPLFFAQADRKDAKESYIKIMDWFVYACGGIFLVTSLFKAEIADILITKPEYHTHQDALTIVPILLLANLFLGIFFNLSIWYKLNNKTKMGALVSVIGAVTTVILLLIYVPVYGFLAAAITTLIAYFLMTIISYFLGQKYYPVKYNIGVVLGLIGLSVGLYIFSEYMESTLWVKYALNALYIAIYAIAGYFVLLSTKKTKFAH